MRRSADAIGLAGVHIGGARRPESRPPDASTFRSGAVRYMKVDTGHGLMTAATTIELPYGMTSFS